MGYIFFVLFAARYDIQIKKNVQLAGIIERISTYKMKCCELFKTMRISDEGVNVDIIQTFVIEIFPPWHSHFQNSEKHCAYSSFFNSAFRFDGYDSKFADSSMCVCVCVCVCGCIWLFLHMDICRYNGLSVSVYNTLERTSWRV